LGPSGPPGPGAVLGGVRGTQGEPRQPSPAGHLGQQVLQLARGRPPLLLQGGEGLAPQQAQQQLGLGGARGPVPPGQLGQDHQLGIGPTAGLPLQAADLGVQGLGQDPAVLGVRQQLAPGQGGPHLRDAASQALGGLLLSCSGIVAEGLPPALGQAYAFRERGSDRVAVAVTGEGAGNQGAFHESLNLAALWSLPVVFVVEDNAWAISVPRAASTSVPTNAARAAAYGIPGERVEGNDPDLIAEAAVERVEAAIAAAKAAPLPDPAAATRDVFA